MDGLWPFRPRPVDDETFSSWFSRLAWANGLEPGELYRVALPGGRMHRADLDRFACDDLIAGLSTHTGVQQDDLRTRTLQRWAINAQGDWGELGSFGPVYPLAYLRILWIVYRLLATGRFAYPLREWVRRNLDTPDVPPSAIPRIKELERLPVQSRHILIQYADALLCDWPSRFVAACKGVGITSRVLLKYPAQTPFALWAPASSELHDGDYQPAPSEVTAARAFLEKRNTRPTRGALNQVLGCKSKHIYELAVAASDHCAYGTNRYWKLDGVSPDVRAAARAAAVHEGHNVGPWVDQILREALKRRGLI